MNELERAQKRWPDTYGNKWWRIENLYKIRDKKKRLVNLKPNRIQRHIIGKMKEQLANEKRLRQLILKYRQGGVSTLMEIYYLDDTIFHRNTITGILAHKKENLGYLFEIPRLAHQYIPDQLRPKLGDDSKTALSFPSLNSKMFVSLEIRSTVVHNLHISEHSFCKDSELQATLGAMPPEASITSETTGNGAGNDFYEKYQEAKKGESEWEEIFIPWFLQEEYRLKTDGPIVLTPKESILVSKAKRDYGVDIDEGQILFRRQKERDLKRLRPQEFPEDDIEAFLTAGSKFFDGRKIMILRNEAQQWEAAPGPVDRGEGWVMFEAPQNGCTYVMGADPAEGVGGDYSVLVILNANTRKPAFRMRGHIGVDAFAREIAKRGRQYFNAHAGVERNNHGHAVLLALRQLEQYQNIYFEEVVTRIVGGETKERKYGWMTDNRSKPLMLDHLKIAIEGNSEEDEMNFEPQMLVLDKILLDEALTLEQVGGKIEAASGKFDDTIVAYAIAWQMYLRCGKDQARNAKNIRIGGERDAE